MRTRWAGGGRFFHLFDSGSRLIGGAIIGAGKELLSFFSDLYINSALIIGPSPVSQYPELDSAGQPTKVAQLHNGSGRKTLRRKPIVMDIEKSAVTLCKHMASRFGAVALSPTIKQTRPINVKHSGGNMSYTKCLSVVAVLSAAVALGGCSSTDKPAKTEVSSAAPVSAPPAESKKPAAPADSTKGSSLDALQRGESTATPASSPLKEVYFDFDSYNLGAEARETLKANMQWLKANPAAQVQIEGHCDERGTTEYNLALGSKRAESVKDYLVTLGTSVDRLTTISYGEELLVCRDQTEECWQKNRRVRFAIQPPRPTT